MTDAYNLRFVEQLEQIQHDPKLVRSFFQSLPCARHIGGLLRRHPVFERLSAQGKGKER
jgi:hypothetical protein